MAGGRDLKTRSPRWLNCLICSCGITSVACFFWRVLGCDSDADGLMLGFNGVASRLLGVAILPALLLLTALGRVTKRLVSGFD
jgi:hypothetical protein